MDRREKGSWVVFRDLYLPPYLCGGAAGMFVGVVCCKVRVEKYPKWTKNADNDFVVGVISDLMVHMSTCVCGIDANVIPVLLILC